VGTCTPCPAVLGHEIRADPKFFFAAEVRGEMENGLGKNLREKTRKAFDSCKLFVIICYFAPRTPPGLRPWTRLGTGEIPCVP